MPTDRTDLTALREAWEREHALTRVPDDPAFYEEVDQSQADDLARRAYKKGRSDGVADCEARVPHTWLDELLSGPHVPKLPWGPREIEWFINKVKARIAAMKGGK